jgi:hypothetical protein
MLERRPDLPSPAVPAGAAAARAAVSPSAVVLGAAGVGLSLVASLPVAAVVGVGLCGWGVGVAVSAAVAAGRRRRARRPEPIDPYAVPDPWRRFVREALTAQTKFGQAVGRRAPGPLHDRLLQIGGRVDDAVRECWRVAQLGAALSAALANLDPTNTSDELRRVQEDRHRLLQAGSGAAAASDLDQTEAALASRLQSTRRVEAAIQRATDRLRLISAQLNEAVASAVELALDTGDQVDATPLAGQVDNVVSEIEALRQAMEETEAPQAGSPP